MKLKELREERGWTQRQAAMKLGLAPTTYNNYEREIRKPNHETMKHLADVYGVSLDYLLGRSNTKKPIDDFDMFMKQQSEGQQEIDDESSVDSLLVEVDFLFKSKACLTLVRNCLELSEDQISILAAIANEMEPKNKRPPRTYHAGLIASEDS